MDLIKAFVNQFKKQGKLNIFSLFLLISFLLWSLIKLSQQYETNIEFNLRYQNVPEKNTLIGDIPEKVNVQLKSNGFRLLKYGFFKPYLSVDLADANALRGNRYFLRLNENVPKLQRQFPNEIKIEELRPDSVIVQYGTNKSKTINLNPKVNLEFKAGYNLTDKLQIEPKNIEISGREDLVDSITSLETEALTLKNLDSDFEEELKIIIPDRIRSLSYSATKITVSGKIEKFTEGQIEVPITVLNVPDGINVKLFPEGLKVSYNVSLKNYKDITADSFVISCDYNDIKEEGAVLIPKLKATTEKVTNYRLLNSTVDYLIKK
ncbi:YbbR-like domain-containing protein [Spongiivirga sp. MCCC 1A20706]|uniref:CdaR family protein n=1 Tax=Spongiivirga sp. MCCC 1A20706 TaxID=3160963 RepID=UPI003977C6F2